MTINDAHRLVSPRGFTVKQLGNLIGLFHPDGGLTEHSNPQEAVRAAEHYESEEPYYTGVLGPDGTVYSDADPGL
jgi:hypothetical protein